jgi:dephospho-CoA kinase
MLTIGLTGGIGTGKSAVIQILGELGALVMDADKVAHTTYAPGAPAYDPVIEAFGTGIVTPEGTIDRKKLGPLVFGNPAQLKKLESIVWPATRDAIRANVLKLRREGATSPIIIEAAILIEANWTALFDEIWLVRAPHQSVLERIERQRGLKPAETEARIRAQLPDSEREKHATLIIDNNGTLEQLRAQLEKIWAAAMSRNG